MKTDAQLKKDVTAELEWDPPINASHVGVTATDGVVTLTGHLNTFAEKYAIERAAQRVQGVKAIAMAERNAAFGAAWSAPGVLSVVNEIRVQS